MTQHVSNTGFAPLAQLEAYWEALRGNRLMPNRAEIDPRGIEQALEYSFIVERIAPGIARLRIAGSHLSDLMGMEVRGMPLTSFITPASRRQLSDVLEEVFETPATCSLQLHSEQGAGLPPLEARMVLMPLKSDLGDVSRILGALISVGEIGRSPRRFDVTRTSLRPIVADASLPPVIKGDKPAPVTAAKEPATKPEQAFREPSVPFRSETPRQHAPYLRLVKTDD
ncbi:MAG: PAS domain-containing protein [Pseudomonadota bacterium]